MNLCIVQARMTSERLPGKVMADVGGAPMIVQILRRLRRCHNIDHVVVGTGPGEENEVIRRAVLAEGVDCPYIACAESDVLSRYVRIAKLYDADNIIRITGDCPLISPEVVDRVIYELGSHEFASNVVARTYPKGLDAEVMTFAALMRLNTLCLDKRREHVTLFIYENPDLFDVVSVTDTTDNSDIRLCVDRPMDLELIREVYERGPSAGYDEDVALVRRLKDETDRIPVGSWSASGSYR